MPLLLCLNESTSLQAEVEHPTDERLGTHADNPSQAQGKLRTRVRLFTMSVG